MRCLVSHSLLASCVLASTAAFAQLAPTPTPTAERGHGSSPADVGPQQPSSNGAARAAESGDVTPSAVPAADATTEPPSPAPTASATLASPNVAPPEVAPASAPSNPTLQRAADASQVAAMQPEASAAAPDLAPAQSDPAATITRAEFGKGVLIGTADESFTLNIRARMQIQAMYYDAHDADVSDVTQIQVRRARVLLQGNVYGPELTYYIQLAFSNRDSEPDIRLPLRDAYFTYAPHASANLRFGQMKVPYGRQRVVSSSALGMVDRSVVTSELNLDRDVGAQVFSKDAFGLGETLGYALGVFGGDGRNRVATNAGYLYVGRLSFTPFGTFDEFVEADIARETRPRLALGVGAAFNQATNRPQSTIGNPYADPTVFFDYTHFGADFMFKWHGFSATGEWMLRRADTRSLSFEDENGETTTYHARELWGAYVQLAQMVTPGLEVSTRYGHLNPLRDTDPKLSLVHELGGGLSYYFEQHNLKVQGDYFYYAKNNKLEAGDHQVRVQTQLFF